MPEPRPYREGTRWPSPADQARTRAHARLSDPATSHAAARSVHDLRFGQRAVLQLLSLGPATDEDLIDRADYAQIYLSPSGIRTRRHELVLLGLVRDSGERRTTYAGRQTAVWEAVPPPG